MSNTFEAIEAQLQADTAQFQSDIAAATDELDGLEKSSNDVNKAIGALGAAVGAVAVGGIAKSIGAASDLNASLTESQAIMGDLTDDEMASMEDAARRVGRETTFAAEEAGEAFYFLASAGMDAEQSVAALDDVAQFAQAGAFDLATATDLATDAQSALGLAAEDAAENQENLNRVMDAMVGANQLANASVEEFSSALTNKAAAAMREVNMEVEEGTAALAVFADQGLKGQRAGTILARTIEGLSEQARENSEAFEDLGVEVFDANGEMRPMADIIEDLEGGLDGMSTEQRDAALAQLGLNQRTAQGVSLMMGNSDALREYEGELDNAGGTAADVADNQLKSFENQLELLRSNITDVAISVGNVLLPPLTALAGTVTSVIQTVAELNDRFDGLPATIGLAGAAVGGFGAAFLALKTTAFAAAIPSLSAIAIAVGAVGAAVVGATAVIGGAAAAWRSDFAGIQTTTRNLADTVAGAFEGPIASATTLGERVVSQLRGQWDENAGGIEDSIAAVVSSIEAALVPTIVWMGDRADRVVERASAAWSDHGDAVVETVARIVDTIIRVGSVLTDRLGKTVATVVAFIGDRLTEAGDLWDEHGDDVTETIGRIIEVVRDVADTVLDRLGDVEGFLRENAGPAFEFLRDVGTTAFDRIRETLEDAWDAASEIFEPLIDWVWDLGEEFGILSSDADTLGERIGDLIGVIFDLKTPLLTAVEWVADLKEAWDTDMFGLRETTEDVVETVTGEFGFLRESSEEDFDGIADAAIAGFTDLQEGITERLDDFREQWDDDFGGLTETVRETFGLLSDVVDEIWVPVFQTITDTVAESMGDVEEIIDHHLGDIIGEFIETLDHLFENVINPALEMFLEVWDEHGDKVLSVLELATDSILLVFETVLDLILTTLRVTMAVFRGDWSEAWGLVEGLFERTFDRILDFATGWGGRLLDWLGGLVSDVLDYFRDLASSLIGNSIIPDMLNSIEEAFGAAVDWVVELVSGFVGSIVEYAGDLRDDTLERVEALTDRVGELFDDMSEAVLGIVSDFTESFTESVSDLRDDTLERVEALTDRVGELFDDMSETVLGVIDGFREDFEGLIDRLQRGVIVEIVTLAVRVEDRIEEMVDDVVGFVTGLKDDAIGLVRDLRDEFVEVLEELTSLAVDEATDLADGVLDAFDIADKAKSAGRDIASGIADGITDRISDAKDAASDLASTVRDHLPGSDADVGPLSDLSSSAEEIPLTLASEGLSGLREVEQMGDALAEAAAPDVDSEYPGTPTSRPVPNGDGGRSKTVTNNVTINVDGADDPEGVAREIERRLASGGVDGWRS